MLRAVELADEPVLWVLVQLRYAGLVAAVLLVTSWIGMLLWRERMLRKVELTVPPEKRAGLRSAARGVPLLRRTRVPRDPYALDEVVVIPPLDDGRPGECFRSPGPTQPPGPVGEVSDRMDATVPLGQGLWMLVYCAGRIGARSGDFVVLPAQERVLLARASLGEGASLLGPVDPVETAAGTGWRTTMAYTSGRLVTDTHVDRDGWAYIIGVFSTSWHARAVDALDHILATWVWLPGRGASAPLARVD